MWPRSYHEYFASLPPLKQPPPSVGHPARVNGSEMCHNTIRTAMMEAAAPDMAFAVHGGNYSSLCSLNLTFAIFMLARNGTLGAPADWFSWSTGGFWESRDWSWEETASLYTTDWGLPKGLAVNSGDVWRREYEKAVVSLDCATLKPTIELTQGPPTASANPTSVPTSAKPPPRVFSTTVSVTTTNVTHTIPEATTGCHFSPLDHQLYYVYSQMVYDESFEQAISDKPDWKEPGAPHSSAPRARALTRCVCCNRQQR